MAKMESRVSYLENNLSGCLDNLDAFSVQLTVIQDFLQKQFGSRFVDYAINRGVYIEKPLPTNRSVGSTNSYYANSKPSSSTAVASSSQDYGVSMGEEYTDETQMEDSSDPMTFVQIVDDSEEKHNVEDEYEDDGEEYYSGMNENEEYGNEDYYEEEDQIGQTEQGNNNTGENGDKSGLVIVNCVSEKKYDPAPMRLPSPPPITARPPPSRTYVKPNAPVLQQQLPVEPPKQRLPSNFLANRKRSSAASTSASSSSEMCSMPKMPLLHPQIAQPTTILDSLKQESIDYGEMLDFSSLTDVGGSGGGSSALEGLLDVKTERMDPECNEDLREYYDVLPDKSVQCKICDKILKAGWHKYGRHYRTHTGEKPFSCQYCGENFARKDNMNNHVKSKHENPRPRPSSNDDTVTLIDTDQFSPMYYLSSELC